jgi:hypothetical protein
MKPLRKIAFLIEEFNTPSPAQQLLDRFLIGYSRDGVFRKIDQLDVRAYLTVTNEASFDRRMDEFGLRVAATAEGAVEGADAVVIASRKLGAVANEALLKIALERAPSGARFFVHGALCNSLAAARHFSELAASREIALLAGTSLGVTWRLPEIDLARGTPLEEALIVVQINPLAAQATPPSPPATISGAELHALEGLLPVIERRHGGESGVRSVRFIEGEEFWRAGRKGAWSWSLLASALSRSHSPQGGAIVDGRTEDLVGLGLVQKLARNPRGWILEHRDGLRSALLVLDGVVSDFNFAVRARDGAVLSAQLLRAPPPAEHHFSRLAALMEDFFRGGAPPWPLQRSQLIAGLLERFRKPASLTGRLIDTPELGISHTRSSRRIAEPVHVPRGGS